MSVCDRKHSPLIQIIERRDSSIWFRRHIYANFFQLSVMVARWYLKEHNGLDISLTLPSLSKCSGADAVACVGRLKYLDV